MTDIVSGNEIAILTANHTYPWAPSRDVTLAEIRAAAGDRRYLATQHARPGWRQLLAEADSLDALADRYGQETV